MPGVELDHAQDIIADIMDTLVGALRPPFRLAKFEGDAAFLYVVADKVDGSLLQDSIEQAYFAFRKRPRNIKQANSCECQACSRMESLDVKFVVHQGEFVRQKMSGREELAGRDVILVHRILKNEVSKTFGARAYALYSDACVQAMGIDPRAQGLVEHAEAIEHIGETKCWASDLEAAWTRESEIGRTVVQLDDGDFLWLSAAKPISGGTGPFVGDLQSWTRDDSDGGIEPDWLRVGTDITHQGPFNASFSLSGSPVREPRPGR
jgi:hypothetical protein